MATPVNFFPVTYIDITTNLINTNTGVTGSNNNFVVDISNLKLDGRYRYFLQLQQLIYLNTDIIGATVFPIVTCDQIVSIYENNTRSNILYKGRFQANNADVIVDSLNTNVTLLVELNVQDNLNKLSLQFFRSDNGAAFPIDPSSYVTMLLA